MALSYSNPNVEAGLWPTHLTLGGKTTRDDSSSSKPSYNKFNSFFSLVQVVVNVVLFAAVIWLVFHVVYLEQEQVKTGGLIVNRKGYPTIVSSHNATNDSSTKNAGFAGNARGRRQAPSTSDTADYGAMPSSYSDYDQAPAHGMGHAFFHVVENSLRQVPGEDRYFEFHTSTEARYSRWTHESLNFIENRFMEVTVPGYYHVYSQMQYSGYQISQVVGHEVVVLPDCSRGDTFVILKTTSHAGETGYTAGVFYLDVNDRVGVRPPGDSSNPITFGGSPSTSFFGAFLLYEDNYGKVRADLEPCP